MVASRRTRTPKKVLAAQFRQARGGGVSLARVERLTPWLTEAQLDALRESIERGVEVPDCLSEFLTNAAARRKLEGHTQPETHDEAYARIAAYERVEPRRDCEVCGLSSFEHPTEIERGYAWLRRLCDGRRVKLV